TTSHQSEWPPSKSLQTINAGEGVEKREHSCITGVSWNSLPDELLLGIFSCLCLPELLKVSSVCKRWYHLAFDESLWQNVDLAGRNLYPDVVGRLLSPGVVAFCCPWSFMDQSLIEHFSPFHLQHLNLSNSVIAVSILQSLLSHCSKLQNLSLEGLQLSDPIVDNLALNTNLLRLNLSGCSGFSESALKTLLSSCYRLDELSLSWCYDFTEKHVQVAVAHVSETITQLNLSGYQKNLERTDVSTLVGRCPNLVHLDLKITTSKTLQVFGMVPDCTLQLLKEALPQLQINCSHFTTIARLTIVNKKNQEIWGIK
ncbi:hypothetical protein FD755_025332, partial [Muntiacus reevesi]